MDETKEENSRPVSESSNECFSPVPIYKTIKSAGVSSNTFRMLRFGSIIQTWTELSRINYVSTSTLDNLTKGTLAI